MKKVYRKNESGVYQKGLFIGLPDIYGLVAALLFVLGYNLIELEINLIIVIGLIFLISILIYFTLFKSNSSDLNIRVNSIPKEYFKNFLRNKKRNQIDEFFGFTECDLVLNNNKFLKKYYNECLSEIEEILKSEEKDQYNISLCLDLRERFEYYTQLYKK